VRRLQFISTKRKEKGVGANIDNLQKAGLGQGFWIGSIADYRLCAEKGVFGIDKGFAIKKLMSI